MTPPTIARRLRLDWLFPVLLTIPLGWMMWVFSGPGLLVFRMLGALAILAAFGLAWLVLIFLAWHRDRPLVWYGVAAILTVVVSGLIALRVPLQARWTVSRSAFDRLAARIAADPDASVSGRIGLYDVRYLRHIDGGWIVHDTVGTGLVDDAGFAYLPAGPTDDLGDGDWENPRFTHLGGPWYSWTASW